MSTISMLRWARCSGLPLIFWMLATPAFAAGIGSDSLASMPIREVSIFKDGHAFISHSGEVTTNAHGNVVLDYLPAPILGTFWPSCNDPAAKLTSVTAGQQRVTLAKTALSLRELLIANRGAKVEIRETGQPTYQATIEGVPTVTAEERETMAPAGSGPQLDQTGELILLRTLTGTRAIAIERIQDVTFIDDPQTQLKYGEIRNLLTLRLDWQGKPFKKTATVGMTYLQKGLRWIPHYNLRLQADGTVQVTLQATLLNELADLNDVTANLLIGVPSFDFKDTIDPIALRETATQLSPYFQEHSQTAQAFSNSVMIQTQSARMGEYRQSSPSGEQDAGSEVSESQNEEIFVFTVTHVTLAQGERMVIPVATWTMNYKDVFQLELPFAPPQEIRQSFNSSQEAELARLFHAPKVKHVLRISNTQAVPLTTAPALITSDKGVLGQGMMTYTSPGGSVDLAVTTAVNVPVSRTDEEVTRVPNAIKWRDHSYVRVELQGNIKLQNFRQDEIELEVTRSVMGTIDSAESNGRIRRPGVWDESAQERPTWWSWYSWPYWWTHMNSYSQVDWKFKLGAGKSVELPYKWHYYWAQ